MATVVMGAKVQPIPTPATMKLGRNAYQAESGCAIAAAQPIPTPNSTSPVIRMYLPPTRSDRRPAMGAVNIASTEAGARVRPAFSAEKPTTDCR